MSLRRRAGWRWSAFPISVLLTALLQFFISYTMAMLAFWLLEISTFIFILFAFEYIASGHLFPLGLLPPALQDALYCTPFPSMLYTPIGIYMGKIAGSAVGFGLLLQLFWLLARLSAGAIRLGARHQEIRGLWRVRK